MDAVRLKNALIGFAALLRGIMYLAISALAICAVPAARKLSSAVSKIEEAAVSAKDTVSRANAMLDQQQGYYRDSASHVKALTADLVVDAHRIGDLIGAPATAKKPASGLIALSASVQSTLDGAKTSLGKFDSSTDALTAMIGATDSNLNNEFTGVLPNIARESISITQETVDTAKKLQDLIGSMTLLSTRAGEKFDDPDFKQMQSALLGTMQNLQGTTGSVEIMADHSQKRLDQLLKPASLTKSIFLGLLGPAGDAARIYGGTK